MIAGISGTGADAEMTRRLREPYGEGAKAVADRELKRLSRRELLEMLIAQGRENERLQAEIAKLQDQLSEREIHLAKSGNIAEAALRLNGVFEAAQRAAEQYLENISRGKITKALIGETDDFVVIDTTEEAVPSERENKASPEPVEEDDTSKKAKRAGKPKKVKQPKKPSAPKKAPLPKLKPFFRKLKSKLTPLMNKLRRKK